MFRLNVKQLPIFFASNGYSGYINKPLQDSFKINMKCFNLVHSNRFYEQLLIRFIGK